MTEPLAFRRFAQIAQRWRNLVEMRCAHFIALHKSGDWKFHYDDAQFLLLMREAIAMAETWAKLAPRPEDEGDGASTKPYPVAPRRRTAA